MFDSIKNRLSRADPHQADEQKLDAEAKVFRWRKIFVGERFSLAKDFRLPSETLPRVFKYLFFRRESKIKNSMSRHPGLSRSLLAHYLPKEFNSVLLRVIFDISNECLKLVIAPAFASTRHVGYRRDPSAKGAL